MTGGIARIATAAGLLAAVAACGGASGGPSRPKPLQYHFKEQNIASVPADGKTDMKAALAEYDRARQESRKAESDYADSKAKLEQARSEASKAHGQKEAADSQREAAEKGKDNFNQVNLAKRDQRVAEVTARAADQKVEMLEAHRRFLEKWVSYTREYVLAAEARYELAKAQVARAHNIAPPDFAYQAYVDQYEQRRRRADKLKGPADEARQAWLDEKKDYQARRQDENEARGIDTAAKTDDDK
jgi:hypothetical protein